MTHKIKDDIKFTTVKDGDLTAYQAELKLKMVLWSDLRIEPSADEKALINKAMAERIIRHLYEDIRLKLCELEFHIKSQRHYDIVFVQETLEELYKLLRGEG